MGEPNQQSGRRDFPVAKGVAPPPGWFQPQPAARYPVARPVAVRVDPEMAIAFRWDPPPVPPRYVARRRSFGWLGQTAVVVVLAGTSMAAGWWLVRGRGVRLTPSAPIAVAEVAPSPPVREPAPVAKVATPPASTPAPPPPPAPKDGPPRSTPPPAKTSPAKSPSTKSASPRPAPTTTPTFAKDILPIFQAKCVTCHGGTAKLKGGLDLRNVSSLLRGGDSGPSINRQNPEQSLLWDVISSDQMPPPRNAKMTSAEKKKLREWLQGGAR